MQLQNLQVLMCQDLFDECEGLSQFLDNIGLYADSFTQYMIVYKTDLLDSVESSIDLEDDYEIDILENLKKILAPFDDQTMIALQ